MLCFSNKKYVLLFTSSYPDRTYSMNTFGFLLIYVSVSFCETDIVILRFSDPSKSRVTKTIIEEVVDGKVISSQVSNVSEVKLK